MTSRKAAGVLLLTAIFICAGHCLAGQVLDRVSSSGTVRIGIPYNMIPQGFLAPNGEWTGFDVDVAVELAKHMNLKLEKVKVNEKTWGPLLSRGALDAAVCKIRHTRSLDHEFDLSVAYFFDAEQILVSKGSIKKVGDLKGHKIGTVQGTSSEKAAMVLLRSVGDEQAEANVVSHPDATSCFTALARSKISGWLDSGLALLDYASRHPGRFELIDIQGSVETLAAALPSDDSAWRDLVNFTIQDMASDGSLDKIYDTWFGPQTGHPFPRKRPIEIWRQ